MGGGNTKEKLMDGVGAVLSGQFFFRMVIKAKAPDLRDVLIKDNFDKLKTEEDFTKRLQEILDKTETYRAGIDLRQMVWTPSKYNTFPKGFSESQQESIYSDTNHAMRQYGIFFDAVKLLLAAAMTQNIRSIEVGYTSIGKSCFGSRKKAKHSPKKMIGGLGRDVYVFVHKAKLESVKEVQLIIEVLTRLETGLSLAREPKKQKATTRTKGRAASVFCLDAVPSNELQKLRGLAEANENASAPPGVGSGPPEANVNASAPPGVSSGPPGVGP